MTTVIAFRPVDDRGNEILDKLEAPPRGLTPQRVPETDGRVVRRYQLDDPDADVDALDQQLDEIDSGWRDHIERP